MWQFGGGGELGIELFEWNQRLSYCNIICFFDQKLEEVCGLPAYKIENFHKINVEYLIISIIRDGGNIKELLDSLNINLDNCIFIKEGYLDKDFGGNYSFSQTGEDRIFLHLLKWLGKKEITYCDVGANDPIRLNNTYLLEKNFILKKGVLIEPDPILYEKLKKVRKNNICLNIGICGAEKRVQDKLEFYVMEDKRLSTFSEESVREYERLGREVKHKIYIECKTLNEIFENYFCDCNIDVLSIDVEGIDFEIVKSIDFIKYYPLIICVETSGYYKGKDEDGIEMIDFLLSKGYIVYADTFLNTIFVKKSEIEKCCKDIITIKG